MVTLDIGCGRKPGGEVNVDINGSTFSSQRSLNKDEKNFVIADAKNLPFKSEVFQKVFSAHLIEHFVIEDSPKIISEWFRVLEREGTFELIAPNLRGIRMLKSYIFDNEIQQGPVYAGGAHKAGYTPKTIKNLIRDHSSKIRFVHKKPSIPHYVWPPTKLLERIITQLFPTLAGDIHIIATKI